jgi:hypothetical protein
MLSLVLLLGNLEAKPLPDARKSDIIADEYAVYSAIVKAKFTSKLIVIHNITINASNPASSDGEYLQRCETLLSELPEVDQAMLADFRKKNKLPYQLSRSFDIGSKYVLISEKDIKRLGAGEHSRPNWAGFDAKYPGSSGDILFSRVGFNSGMNRAVVYVVHGMCGLGCGEGMCIFLAKEDGIWKIKKGATLWEA